LCRALSAIGVLCRSPRCKEDGLLDGVDDEQVFRRLLFAVEWNFAVQGMKLNDVTTGFRNGQHGQRHLPRLANPHDALLQNLRRIAARSEVGRREALNIGRSPGGLFGADAANG
jgi:hypothetical protein